MGTSIGLKKKQRKATIRAAFNFKKRGLKLKLDQLRKKGSQDPLQITSVFFVCEFNNVRKFTNTALFPQIRHSIETVKKKRRKLKLSGVVFKSLPKHRRGSEFSMTGFSAVI